MIEKVRQRRNLNMQRVLPMEDVISFGNINVVTLHGARMGDDIGSS
jgi:hypothetical protein